MSYSRLLHAIILFPVLLWQAFPESAPVSAKLFVNCPEQIPGGAVYVPITDAEGLPGMLKVPVGRTQIEKGAVYQGVNPFPLYEQPDPTSTPIAKIQLKEGVKQAAIVLLPVERGDRNGYVPLVLNLADAKPGYGQRVLYNLTKWPLALEVSPVLPLQPGSKKNFSGFCDSGSSLLVPALDGTPGPWAPLPLIIGVNKDGGWRKYTQGRWFNTPHMRHYVFVYSDGVHERARMYLLSQIKSEET